MITKRPLFYWILRRHRLLQLLLLLIIVASIFCRVIPLELQKRIINTAIQLKKTDLLLLYCGLYLAAVVLFSSLKYAINVLQTYIGQKVLVEMRNELYAHILMLPLQFFRQTQPGTVMTSLTAELNAVGFFLGGALAVPVTSALTLLAFTGYMIFLDYRMALICLAIYPAEIFIIPILQSRYNRLNSVRVDETRAMSNAVGEAISGIHEIQGNASYRLEQERFGVFVDRLFSLMNRMFLFSFGTKFVNNFFQNLGPFFLFLVGGMLTIQGRLSLGALVAFLSAFDKISDPWKDMIDYYQDYQDSQVRYRRIMEAFDVEPEFAVAPVDRPVHHGRGEIEVQDLAYTLDNGVHLLDGVSFHLQPGQQMALVGFSGSGKSTLAMVLAQMYRYTRGQVLLDGHELRQLTKMDVSCNIGYVAQHPFIFNGTIRDNILYGSRALLLGGCGAVKALPERAELLRMVRTVGLHGDIIRFGLNAVLPYTSAAPLVTRLIRIREQIRDSFGEKLAESVELYDVHRFLSFASLYENLLFSDVHTADYLPEALPSNRAFLKFLAETHLEEPLLELGREVAQQAIVHFTAMEENGTPPAEAGLGKREHFHAYHRIMNHVTRGRTRELRRKERAHFLLLALGFVPAQNKKIRLPAGMEDAIVQARHRFIQEVVGVDLEVCTLAADGMEAPDPQRRVHKDFSPYCSTEYHYSHTLFDNLVYGSLKADQTSGMVEVMEEIVRLLTEEQLLDDVMDAGLDFEVGSKGDRLSGGQQQKIALARALLKESPILIMDEATASLDNASQAHIQRFIETELRGKTTVVAVMHRLDMVPSYDQILVMRSGRVIEAGTYDELMGQEGVFYRLVQGNG